MNRDEFFIFTFGSIALIVCIAIVIAYIIHVHRIKKPKEKINLYCKSNGYEILELKGKQRENSTKHIDNYIDDFDMLFNKNNDTFRLESQAVKNEFFTSTTISLAYRMITRRRSGTHLIEKYIDIDFSSGENLPKIAFFKGYYTVPGFIQHKTTSVPINDCLDFVVTSLNPEILEETDKLEMIETSIKNDFSHKYNSTDKLSGREKERYLKDLDTYLDKLEPVQKKHSKKIKELIQDNNKNEEKLNSLDLNFNVMTDDESIPEILSKWLSNGVLELINSLKFGMIQIHPNRILVVSTTNKSQFDLDNEVKIIKEIVYRITK